jgi:predicted enzyme related to lactoylglutathione lyase
MNVRLGSVVLGSTDPERLAGWYRETVGLGPDGELAGGGRLIFDRRADVGAAAGEPGRILVNLYVDDLVAVAARLTRLGVEWVRPVEAFPPGLISTVRDPDGNLVQFVEPAAR